MKKHKHTDVFCLLFNKLKWSIIICASFQVIIDTNWKRKLTWKKLIIYNTKQISVSWKSILTTHSCLRTVLSWHYSIHIDHWPWRMKGSIHPDGWKAATDVLSYTMWLLLSSATLQTSDEPILFRTCSLYRRSIALDVSKAVEICLASGFGAYDFALISSFAGWSKRATTIIPSDCTTPIIASHWHESTVLIST